MPVLPSRVAFSSRSPPQASVLWPARSSRLSCALAPPCARPSAPSGTPCRRTPRPSRSEVHTSELQSRPHLVCRLLLEKKKKKTHNRKTAYSILVSVDIISLYLHNSK